MASALLRLTMHKGKGARFGATVATAASDTSFSKAGELTIMKISESGLIQEWNARRPSKALMVGDIIAEVNGKTEVWAAMEELAKFGRMSIVVRRCPCEDVALDLLADNHATGPCRLVLQHQEREKAAQNRYSVCFLPTLRAGDAGVDQCAICLESVDEDEGVAHLSCGHGFHQCCMGRWIQQGKTNACPLCRGDVYN